MTDRQDDKVDKDGVPLSKAHKELYENFDKSRREILAHIDRKIESHELDENAAARAREALARIDLDAIGDAVLGTRKAEFLGGGRNKDGIVDKVDGLVKKVGNGTPAEMDTDQIEEIVKKVTRTRRKLSPAQWTFFGVVVVTLGTILVQILQTVLEINRGVP